MFFVTFINGLIDIPSMTDDLLREYERVFTRLTPDELRGARHAFGRALQIPRFLENFLTRYNIPHWRDNSRFIIPYHLTKKTPADLRDIILGDDQVTILVKIVDAIEQQDKPRVRSLVLASTETFEPQPLAPFTALRELDITAYTKHYRAPDFAQYTPALTALTGSFGDQTLAGIVRHLRALEKVHNQDGHILTAETALAVTQLTFLQDLRARDSGYKNHLPYLSQARRLKSLDLGRNKISDRDLRDIVLACPHLEQLTLDFNDITSDGALELAKLRGLRTLDLSFTSVGPNAVYEIKRKIPEIIIYA